MENTSPIAGPFLQGADNRRIFVFLPIDTGCKKFLCSREKRENKEKTKKNKENKKNAKKGLIFSEKVL